jgi:hypothetical protein
VKRWLRPVVLALMGTCTLVATLVVLVADSGRFAWVGSCGSDNMSAVQFELDRYRAEHGGALPGSSAEFVGYMTRARGADQFRCAATGRSYVWRPGLHDEKGREVVVMCPPGSHGLIRRFSLALVAADRLLRPCLVRGSRVESIDGR